LNYPHSVSVIQHTPKGEQKKTETGVINRLNREKLKKRFGEEKFKALMETDSYYKKFKDPVIPKGCNWIFRQFLYIYNNTDHDGLTGNVKFTFNALNEYCRCMGTPLTIAEKKLLLRMNSWANEQIAEFDQKEN